MHLNNHQERLKEDHRRARELGDVLRSSSLVSKVEPIETNILIFEADLQKISSEEMVARLEQKGIRLIGMGQGKLRLVTHLDYTEEQHSYTLECLQKLA